jgi:hypothetical protein
VISYNDIEEVTSSLTSYLDVPRLIHIGILVIVSRCVDDNDDDDNNNMIIIIIIIILFYFTQSSSL